MVASSKQPGIKYRAVPILAVPFLVPFVGPVLLEGLAHSARLVTIRVWEYPGSEVLSGVFRVGFAFACNVPVVVLERRLLNLLKHATGACSRR